MRIEPIDWNVVVLGFWNRAILTPAGIGRRLFHVEEGTPLQVEIPLEGLAPHRVRHEGLIVTAESGRLVVATESPDFPSLEHAMAVAATAIDGLPETPLSAAGFNTRYHIHEPPNDLTTACMMSLDHRISEADLTICGRQVHRAVKFREGLLNLEIRDDTVVKVSLNFHLGSTSVTASSKHGCRHRSTKLKA
jgi:hypothetical protein